MASIGWQWNCELSPRTSRTNVGLPSKTNRANRSHLNNVTSNIAAFSDRCLLDMRFALIGCDYHWIPCMIHELILHFRSYSLEESYRDILKVYIEAVKKTILEKFHKLRSFTYPYWSYSHLNRLERYRLPASIQTQTQRSHSMHGAKARNNHAIQSSF